jgi:PST family polysaccharide transporter
MTEALLNAGASIAMAPFFGVWALVGGALAGPSAYALISYFLAPYRPRLRFDRTAASSLIRFGRWMFATGIIGLVGRFVLQAVISRRLGTAELGLYYLAAKIAYLPTEISGELVGAVAFPLYARLQYDAKRAARAFRFVLTGMAAALLPIMGLLIVLAPSVVEDLLGTRWLGTAPIIQVLAVATLIGLFGDVINPAFKGLGQPYKVALLSGVQTALLVSLVWDLAGRYGLAGAAAAWLPATALTQIVGFVLLRRLFPRPLAGLGKPILIISAITATGTGIAYLIDRYIPGILGLFTAASCAMAVIAALLWLADRRMDLGLGEIVSRIFPRLAPLFRASSSE